MDAMGDKSISVVIPTYNRAAVLDDCLLALECQVGTGVAFEVVVVDDGSTDSTIATVHRAQARGHLALSLLRQENQGPAVARNRGVKAARGDLILFLGDDILVKPEHLVRMSVAYHAYQWEPRGILGHTSYHPDCIPTPFGRWLDHDSMLQFDYQSLRSGARVDFRHFYTSNILVPRHAILEAGGFSSGFRSAAYEDTELGYRLMTRGLQLYYCPDAEALHYHLVTVGNTRARMRAVARSILELRTINPNLFAVLHPAAGRLIDRPSRPRRLLRWLSAFPMARAVEIVDGRMRWPLPGICYDLTMQGTCSAEVSRLSRARAVADDPHRRVTA